MSQDIHIGDRVDINFKDPAITTLYISQVKAVKGDIIILDPPTAYGKTTLPVDEETALKFYFATEQGILSFNGKVLESKTQDGCLTIQLLAEQKRIQRRDYYRLPCVLPFNFYVLEDIDDIEEHDEQEYSGVIKDVSSGGLRFIAREDLGEVKYLKCLLDFDTKIFAIAGVVLQKQIFPRSKYKYQYRIKFYELDGSDETRITKFVFDEKRRLLAKQRKGSGVNE